MGIIGPISPSLVTYAQMTHPARDVGAERVRHALDRPCDVYTDRKERGPWWPARMAWEQTPATSTWRCLIQDDIDLAPGFADTLEWLLANYGHAIAGRPLALYNGLRDRAPNGRSWLERRDGVQGPVIVMATADVGPMLDWCEQCVRDSLDMTSSDIRPSLWLEAMGRTSLCPDLSWVQHRGWEPSLLGTKSQKSQPRTAPNFHAGPLSGTDWRLGLNCWDVTFGKPNGASERVRWKLWRTWQTRPDHELIAAGLDPRVGAPLGAYPRTDDEPSGDSRSA